MSRYSSASAIASVSEARSITVIVTGAVRVEEVVLSMLIPLRTSTLNVSSYLPAAAMGKV